MAQIHFYGVMNDFLPMLELAESKGPLKYTLTGNFLKDEWAGITTFDTAAEMPNLGRATGDQAAKCDHYLVCEQERSITLQSILGYDGLERICIDQLLNHDTMEFTPAGLWNESLILAGRIATAWDTEHSRALMKRFQAAIKRSFTKVRAYYVGPNAMALWKNGARLTIGVNSSYEFDLAPLESTK